RGAAGVVRDEPPPAPGPGGLAGVRVQELAEEVPRVEMHAVVRPALARDGTDLRLADVVEELDRERAAERRGERLRRREADPVRQRHAHLARGLEEVREEARRAGVDRRAVVVRDL